MTGGDQYDYNTYYPVRSRSSYVILPLVRLLCLLLVVSWSLRGMEHETQTTNHALTTAHRVSLGQIMDNIIR